MPSLKEGEVLIEVEAFGLNFAEVMARRGLYREAPKFPFIPGYEVVGKVVQVSSNTNENLLHKRVVAFTRFGGYAQYVSVNQTALITINEMPAGIALSLCTQGVTAYYMAEVLSPIRKNELVLIHSAAGGVGSILIQLAKQKGAKVIAKIGANSKKEYVEKLGADWVVNYKETNYIEWLIERNLQPNVIFNPIGGKSFKEDYKLLSPGGRIFIYGGAQLLHGRWGIFSILSFIRNMGKPLPIGSMMMSKSILGVNMLKIADRYPEYMQEYLDEIITAFQNGKLVSPEIQEFNWCSLPQAHEQLESGNTKGKMIVFVDSVVNNIINDNIQSLD